MREHHTYKTKQQQILLDYFTENHGKHITISDISRHFKQMGEVIGTSTIYRRLNKLVQEGVVKRYVFSDSAAAAFEYVGQQPQDVQYHLKCKSCGTLVHLECDLIRQLTHHVRMDHEFELDLGQTVFYGVCAACRRAG